MWAGCVWSTWPKNRPLDEGQTVLATVFASELPQMQLVRRYEEPLPRWSATRMTRRGKPRSPRPGAEMDRTDAWAVGSGRQGHPHPPGHPRL